MAAELPEYVFGPFRLDTGRELLRFGKKVIPLPGRLFAILQTLIEADGNVVSREELQALIWPERGMPGWNLSQHIYMLRQILGESARDRQYIMTVHGKGFRFAAPVMPTNGKASLQTTKRDGAASADENPLQAGYDVFAFYSRASALLERPSAATIGKAIEQYNCALRIDSKFAPALVGMARAYALLAQNAYAAGDWALPRALDAIERALEIAPASASAHAVNAGVALLARWDYDAAKRSIDAAMELNAESTLVRACAALLCESVADYAGASIELQQALLVAPYSPHLQLLFGKLLVLKQEYERAIEHLSNLIDIDPDFSLARQYRAEAQILAGRPQEAIVALLCMQRDPREDVASRLPLLCQAYADAGDYQEAEVAYQQLLAASRTDFVAHSSLAWCAVGLKRFDEGLDHLERALAAREPSLLMLRVSPWFARITPHERLRRVLQGIKTI